MTEVLQSSPSHFPSPSSSSSTPCVPNDISHHHHHQQQQQYQHTLINPTTSISTSTPPPRPHHEIDIEQELQELQEEKEEEKKRREREGDQLSLVTLLVAAFRRSIVGCSITATAATAAIAGTKELCKMEIGVPTNVRHVAHVTFDRFNGFLGLPVDSYV